MGPTKLYSRLSDEIKTEEEQCSREVFKVVWTVTANLC